MKKLTSLLIVFIVSFFVYTATAQDEGNQIYYCYEEIVSPDKLGDYLQISKEIVDLCKENEFPYSFYTWTTGDFKYQLWTPIKSLDEIDKMDQAWLALYENWDKEKLAKFRKSKIKNYAFTMNSKSDLNYVPEEPRLKEGEGKFLYWQEYYLYPGAEQEAEYLVKESINILKNKNYDTGWNFGYGNLGYETPCLIAWVWAKDRLDYWEYDKKFQENFSEDFKELNNKFIPLIRTKKSKDMWYLEELSYVIEE